ncbi:hypothetical protein QYQ99_00990 [Comamonas testosteroni]|uniref:hypothetical protein n=1 Tax=Comamonas testosteroni TaxID=285 RepID=UPI00265FFF84|nr:hypothetical protein [Comamonas testosteroni]WKL16178.1 hypothetical protein QYQ99_00990 [Comamonas testosteroni]WQD45362.1 hypothetical protein U0024_11665 [Comamonas testosteroni]
MKSIKSPSLPARRTILSAGVSAAGLALVGPVLAQGSINKLPKVWMDFDQVALDKAYDQAALLPNIESFIDRCAWSTAVARSRIGAPRMIS